MAPEHAGERLVEGPLAVDRHASAECVKWIVGTGVAVAGLVVAALRLLG